VPLARRQPIYGAPRRDPYVRRWFKLAALVQRLRSAIPPVAQFDAVPSHRQDARRWREDFSEHGEARWRIATRRGRSLRDAPVLIVALMIGLVVVAAAAATASAVFFWVCRDLEPWRVARSCPAGLSTHGSA
jgi:hypothetical protein